MSERNVERRCWAPTEELRITAAKGQPTSLEGLACPYGRLSEDLDGFRELIEPGAFSEALTSGRDLRADVEHDRSKLLGRTSRSTLVFTDGGDGLRASITLPNTQLGRDTAEEVKTGLRDALSVSWQAADVVDRFTTERGQVIRRIVKATLTGVGVTAFPAYPQTAGTLALRSLDAFLLRTLEHSDQPALQLLRLRLQLAEAM